MQFLAGVVTSIHTDAEEAQCGPEQEAADDQRGDEPRRVDQRRRDRRRIRLLACNHRHRIDKYLDTLLANQPISDGEATDRCKSLRRKMADCPI